MRLAVAIMHDRRREGAVDALLHRLGDVQRDPQHLPHATADVDGRPVYLGDGTRCGSCSAMHTALALAVTCTQPDAVLLLEDDAVPPPAGLLQAAEAIAEANPMHAVSLFATERQAGRLMDAAQRRGHNYAQVLGRIVPTLAMVIPAPLVRGYLRWACNPWVDHELRLRFAAAPRAGDARLHVYFEEISGELPTRLTAWSLVEHGMPHPQQSLERDDHAEVRRAYALRQGDILSVDWSVTPWD